MNAPGAVAANFINVGMYKVRLHLGKMFLLAVMAGAFIALAGLGAATASCMVSSLSVAKLVGACVFPAGLTMVLLAGSELFTGNCLLIIPLLSRKIMIAGMLRNWLVVYIGNFIGSILVAMIAVYSHQLGLFSDTLVLTTMQTAAAKCSMGIGDAFLRGIACNFLVCIAVWIAFAATDVVGKIAGLYLPIMLFVVSGFEHSIANMYYGPVGVLAKGVPQYAQIATQAGLDLSVLSWGNFFIHNLIPVTIGNVIGGVLVGAVYWYCYLKDKKEQEKKDLEKRDEIFAAKYHTYGYIEHQK